jgi:hypothetical protein
MSFEHPTYLYALLAIAVVIIIHLLNLQKFKKVHFSNIKILKELVEEQRKKTKFQQWFLMLLRSLIVGFLVLAFAQWFPDSKTKLQSDVLSIFIDNSTSSVRKLGEPTILELQKKYAKDLIENVGAKKIQLLTNDQFKGKYNRPISPKQALNRLKSIQPTNYRKQLDEVVQKLTISDTTQKSIFLFSDFQSNQHQKKIATKENVFLGNFSAVQKDNIAIENITYLSPIIRFGKKVDLLVDIKNFGNSDRKNISLKLYLGDQLKTIQEISLSAFEQASIPLSFVPYKEDNIGLRLEIEDPYFTFDNEFYSVLPINNSYNVVLISNQQKSVFKPLFSGKEFNLKVHNENNIDFSDLEKANFIILDNLQNWSPSLAGKIKEIQAEKSVDLCIIPSQNLACSKFLELMNFGIVGNWKVERSPIRYLQKQQSLFDGVFAKEINKIQGVFVDNRIDVTNQLNGETILQFDNKKPFLHRFQSGKGRTYLYFSTISESLSYTQHSLIVPITLNMAYLSKPKITHYIIGKTDRIPLTKASNKDLLIYHNGNAFEGEQITFQNKSYLLLDDRFKSKGWYAQGDSTKYTFGLNINSEESSMDFLSDEDLTKIYQNDPNIVMLSTKRSQWDSFIKEQGSENTSWKWFLLTALILYFIEMFYIAFINRKNA